MHRLFASDPRIARLSVSLLPPEPLAPESGGIVKSTHMRAFGVVGTAGAGCALALGSVAVSAPGALAAPSTFVNSCGTVSAKPAEIVLSCADANSSLEKLTWSSWTNGNAKASGTYQENDCEPTCVAGTVQTYAAEVQLGKPRKQGGKRVFSEVTITFPKGGPGNFTKMVLPLGNYPG